MASTRARRDDFNTGADYLRPDRRGQMALQPIPVTRHSRLTTKRDARQSDMERLSNVLVACYIYYT